MALYSIAKKMFGDPFGPLSPPSMVLWMPPMSPVRGLDGPVTTGFAGSNLNDAAVATYLSVQQALSALDRREVPGGQQPLRV